MREDIRIIESSQGAFPIGVHVYKEYVHFSVEADGERPLILCLHGIGEEVAESVIRLEFPEVNILGRVRYVDVSGIDIENFLYSFEYSDGETVKDAYARRVYGWEAWGDTERNQKIEKYGFASDAFNWDGDKNPNIPLSETVIYRLHVRGFTKHVSSKVRYKGTFAGIGEKIPYLKDLGITTVELMIPIEFNEVRKMDYTMMNPDENGVNINYWGYGKGYFFAPKSAYSSGNPVNELKALVKQMHRNGLEIIIELNFDNSVRDSYVIDCLRYWTENYHVDGFRLGGCVPLHSIAQEPAFNNIKLFAPGWSGGMQGRNLIEYNDGYLMDMRRFLKGDENTISGYLNRMTGNHANGWAVNYFADNNTLTMMDMVSYDVKHNEANGERNRDGQDYNFSWNCGFEGSTRKKKIIELRRKLLFNAFTMLFLSQGIPMLRAGDEMGQSKEGNNNAYCQDNRISWLNWRLVSSNRDIFEYVKAVIAFRKQHDLFRREKPLREDDYDSLGLPEFSVHGVNPWFPQFEHFRRQLGLLYFGEYSDSEDKESYYLMANMHWECHEFLLPKVLDKKKWELMLDTSKENVWDEKDIESQSAYMMQPRSVAILKTAVQEETEQKDADKGKK